MARSEANGDYQIIGAVQPSTQGADFYAVMLNVRSPWADEPNRIPSLSCDCPAWIRNARGETIRACKHTDAYRGLFRGAGFPNSRPLAQTASIPDIRARQPLLEGVHGNWQKQERMISIGDDDYHATVLNVTTPNGIVASGSVALRADLRPTPAQIRDYAAAWAGWQIARSIARASRVDIGAPPARFRLPAPARVNAPGARPTRVLPTGRDSLLDLLFNPDDPNLGDGLQPSQRAETLLASFLGQQYPILQRQNYLDVPSSRPAEAGEYLREMGARVRSGERDIVYRVRIDPGRMSGYGYERRVRLFVSGEYRGDLCIVRREYSVPLADHFLSVFMGFLTDELSVLRVVGRHNVFSTFSDGQDAEGPAPVRMAPRIA